MLFKGFCGAASTGVFIVVFPPVSILDCFQETSCPRFCETKSLAVQSCLEHRSDQLRYFH